MKINILEQKLRKVLSELEVQDDFDITFETPNNPEHGDLATNVALRLASILKKSPRDIAALIKEKLGEPEGIDEISIAGPGFINFRFDRSYFYKELFDALKFSENFGKSKSGEGKSINVEYVSANPTGLLHLGHGRNAAIGDTICNLYEWLGYNVTREYYFNNAGNQMNNLVNSIHARYLEILGEKNVEFPEDGYHGEYIKDIAKELESEYSDELREGNFQDKTIIKKFGEGWCFDKIKQTLSKMNIKQDIFYNEDSLYKEGKINQVIEDLREKNLVYEKDGATWLKLSEMGLDQDRVIVKSSGEPTYRLPDIAYHREKLKRGYDQLVDVFGADHIATVPDVLAGVKALGYNPELIKVIIHQFVTLTENGQQVKMSKRTGKSFTLDDLLDEVGPEVVRFFLIMRGVSTHLEFDLSLAKEQSDKNPVFYLQYAHARINSILNNLDELDKYNINSSDDFSPLKSEYEINLIKEILNFPEQIKLAAEKYEPQILVEYLRQLASIFSTFYHECRIIGEEEEILNARVNLILITKTVLKNGLSILGISAPEKM